MTTYEVRVEVVERNVPGPPGMEAQERVLWKCIALGLTVREAYALFEKANDLTVSGAEIK